MICIQMILMLVAVAADGASLEPLRKAYLDGRDQEAVLIADQLIAEMKDDASVIRGEVHFWRGAALRRLERHKEALIALDTALSLGFPGAALRLERALTLRSLGRQEDAEREFQEAERQSQDDPDKLEELRKRWKESADLDKRFQFRIYPAFGYDSNILAVNDTTPLAGDLNRESFYYGVQFSARFLAFQEKETALILDYQNNLRGYASEPGLSFSDNLLSAIWQSPVGKLDWLAYEIRGSWGEAWLQDDGHFRTLRTVAPALIFRPEGWQLRLWGDYTDADYYDETPPEQDRDGEMFRGGLAASIEIAGGWKIGPRVTFWDYRADGDDYDHHAWDFGTDVTTPEFAGFQIRLAFGVVLADYDNPHSLSNFTEARSDRRYSVRLTLIFRQLEKVLGFAPTASIGFEKWVSNIEAFDFDRFDLGASADILALSF